MPDAAKFEFATNEERLDALTHADVDLDGIDVDLDGLDVNGLDVIGLDAQPDGTTPSDADSVSPDVQEVDSAAGVDADGGADVEDVAPDTVTPDTVTPDTVTPDTVADDADSSATDTADGDVVPDADAVGPDADVGGDSGDAVQIDGSGNDGDTGDGQSGGDGDATEPACSVDADCLTVFSADEVGACGQPSCKVGKCVVALAAPGELCDDGNPCTHKSACVSGGACLGTALTDCSDGNACTTDVCDPGSGCAHPPASGACDDGEPCSTPDFCKQGGCAPGPVDLCDDGDACTKDVCDFGSGGCSHTVNVGQPCDDGNPCTGSDACGASGCKGNGKGPSCDDTNPCTSDVCDPQLGCTHSPSATATCDDQSACTVSDHCALGVCTGTAVPDCKCNEDKNCEDGNPCTYTPCVALIGKCGPAQELVGKACSDGDPCTVGDMCNGDTCKAFVAEGCNDDNPCTIDACNGGCTHTATTDPCDDGTICTTSEVCVQGACVGQALACTDDSPCTSDACDPVLGCVHTPNTAPCDDGVACTSNDTCFGGVCGGTPSCGCTEDSDCSDGNPCTTDTCGTDHTCTHAAGTGPCSDADACTTGDSCAEGVCKPGTPTACDDGKVCTADACNPQTGCVHPSIPGPCDDGNPCTSATQCNGDTCSPGKEQDCDDGNPCTTDGCDITSGCTHNALPDKTSCNGSDACIKLDCFFAKCVQQSVVNCDDGQQCTTDKCDPATGSCDYEPFFGACDDGDVCTLGESCAADQKCKPMAVNTCDDQNPCTLDQCSVGTGCSHDPALLHGQACTLGDKCVQNLFCNSGVCEGGVAVDCDDSKPCTDDGCSPATGCTHTNSTAPCDDGQTCTAADTCAGGTCVGGPKLFDTHMGNATLNDHAYAIAAMPDGGFAVAGTGGSKGSGYVVRTNAVGQVIWQLELQTEGTTALHGISSNPDGSMTIVGEWWPTGAAGSSVWMSTVNADGTQGQALPFSVGNGDNANFVLRGEAKTIVGGSTLMSGESQALIGFQGKEGGISLSIPTTGAYYAGTLAPNGDVLAAGHTKDQGGTFLKGLVTRVTQDGGVLWNHKFESLGEQNHVLYGALTTTNGFLFAGSVENMLSTTTSMWLVRTDFAGDVVEQAIVMSLNNSKALGIVAGAEDGAILVGQDDPLGDGNLRGTLVGVDSGGSVIWKKAYGNNTLDVLRAAVRLPDGGIAAAGSLMAPGTTQQDVWLQRTDAFGYASCGASGTCEHLLSCSDANPCTVDTCDPAVGCTAVLKSPGTGCTTGCGMGETCSASGVCEGGIARFGLQATTSGEAATKGVLPLGTQTYWTTQGESAGKGVIHFGAVNQAQMSSADYGIANISGNDQVEGLVEISGLPALYGSAKAGDAPWTAFVSQRLTDGSASWTQYYMAEGADAHFRTGAWSPYGGIFGGDAYASAAAGQDGLVVSYNSTGTKLWSRLLGGLSEDSITAIGASNDAVMAAGTTNSFGSTKQWMVARMDKGGGLVWQKTYPLTNGSVTDLELLADGDAVVLGTAVDAGASQIILTRIGANGNLKWTRVLGATTNMTPQDLLRVPGGFVALGPTTLSGKPCGVYVLNSAGSEQQFNVFSLAGGGCDSVRAVRGDEGFWLGTTASNAGVLSATVLKTNHRFQAMCDGYCSNQAANACDDQNACTLDSCNFGTGICAHTPLSAGSVCDDGVLCTVQDGCQSGLCTGTAGIPDRDGDGDGEMMCGGNDCDDTRADRHVGATEICDASVYDNDCDGYVDEECVCPDGFDKVAMANGYYTCAPDFPVWGNRNPTPAMEDFQYYGSDVYDSVTRLEWQDSYSSPLNGTTAESACAANGGWRLPTVAELQTIAAPSGTPDVTASAFLSHTGGCFWTATRGTTGGSQADRWAIDFTYAVEAPYPLTSLCRTRCVRTFTPWPALTDRWQKDVANKAVVDRATGLTWRTDVQSFTATPTAAAGLCQSLAAQGPWRAPNLSELRGLVSRSAYNPAINLDVFEAIPPGTEFLSTTWGNGTSVFGVAALAGEAVLLAFSDLGAARCVH